MSKRNTYKKKAESDGGKSFAKKRHSVMRGIVSGEFFTQEGFIKNLPFILFLSIRMASQLKFQMKYIQNLNLIFVIQSKLS